MPCLLSLRDTPNGDAAKLIFATPPFFFDVLFLRKRRVVSSKTTCCFFENDVSLFQNDRSFSMDVWEWKSNIEERENEYREFYL